MVERARDRTPAPTTGVAAGPGRVSQVDAQRAGGRARAVVVVVVVVVVGEEGEAAGQPTGVEPGTRRRPRIWRFTQPRAFPWVTSPAWRAKGRR